MPAVHAAYVRIILVVFYHLIQYIFHNTLVLLDSELLALRSKVVVVLLGVGVHHHGGLAFHFLKFLRRRL